MSGNHADYYKICSINCARCSCHKDPALLSLKIAPNQFDNSDTFKWKSDKQQRQQLYYKIGSLHQHSPCEQKFSYIC